MIEKNNLIIDDERDFYDDYPKIHFAIQDWHNINAVADAIRQEKGLIPMFDFENEHDENGWYDFSIECELKDDDITNIELWFRVENGEGNDNQCSYKIELSDYDILQIHDWLIENEETSEFIKAVAELEGA